MKTDNQKKATTQLTKIALEQLESIAGGPEGNPCGFCLANTKTVKAN